MRNETESDRDCILRLHLTEDALRFSMLEAPSAVEVGKASVRSISSIRGILQHEPPTAPELEAAIAEVEDLIMPVIRTLPSGCVLEVAGRELREVMAVLSPLDAEPVSIEAVEILFSRLARIAMGSPARSEGVPVTVSFALGLLLIREVMHHRGVHSVKWV